MTETFFRYDVQIYAYDRHIYLNKLQYIQGTQDMQDTWNLTLINSLIIKN